MKKTSKLIFATLPFVLLASCGKAKNAETQEERVEQVKVETIKKTEIAREIELSTTLQGYETMNIAPSITGKIEHIYVDVSDYVSKGQTLVRMDQSQLNTTRLTYTNLGIEMARMEALIESGSISQQTYDQAKLQYDQTKENLDFLEKNTFVKAGFAGVISAKNYEDGELYSGQTILVLTQINQLKAYINIPETYFPLIKTGMNITLRSDIYKDKTFAATIETVFPTIDPATHTFKVKLKIPNASQQLRPGMYVHTTLSIGKEEAIVVPYQSVLKLIGSNDRYIFLNNNGKAKRVSVKLGQRFDEKIEILNSDIVPGDEIITVGQAKLIDGVKLNIIK